MFLHQAAIACGMTLVAYYHNEAAAVCDSHFAHQQLRVEAYIAEGEWGRKVSTPKQLAVALSTKFVKNTTVLLVKPKHDCPFMAAKLPPIKGISTYLAAHYDHHSETPQLSFFHNLGQSIPSQIAKLIPAPLDSYDQDPFGNPGVNFSGCRVQFHNMDSESDASKARHRYIARPVKKSKRQQAKEKSESIKAEAMKDVCSIYPQCTRCQCHFKSALGREKHKCKGPSMQCSGVSMAVCYANEVLSTRNFTVDGQARAMVTSITNPGTSTYASFEVNFSAGWAHCQKNQHPALSTRVQDFIAQCWHTG